MRIAIGCDHGGIVLKEACVRAAESLGHTVDDLGTYDARSVDYPDYALKVALAVKSGEADRGILLCGTGIGMAIAANKVKGIRCAHVTDGFSARMSAEHNDAQIIAMGGRISTPEEAEIMVKEYLSAKFAGGRHQNRVDKITGIENGGF